MLELYGTHGTSSAIAQKILKSNAFRPGRGKSRAGRGVYFWRKGEYSDYLAIAWWKFRFPKGSGNGAIIHVVLSIKKEEYLNTDEFDLKEAIIRLSKRLKKGSERQLAAIYDLFVYNLEKKQNVKYKVLEARVPTPPNTFCPEYPLSLIGVPHVYVVRHVDCIEIKGIKECKQ